MGEKNIKSDILAAILAIPRGSVRSYGQVAASAGYPGRARAVARILSESSDPSLPWHRVLRASGRFAFPADSPLFAEQTRRLRAEGVVVKQGRVVMPDPAPDLDALLWAPH